MQPRPTSAWIIPGGTPAGRSGIVRFMPDIIIDRQDAHFTSRLFLSGPPEAALTSGAHIPLPLVLNGKEVTPIVLSPESRSSWAMGGEDLEPYFFGPIEML